MNYYIKIEQHGQTILGLHYATLLHIIMQLSCIIYMSTVSEHLRRSYDGMAEGLQQKEQFEHKPIPWTPRRKGIDDLLHAEYQSGSEIRYGIDALIQMYGLSDHAAHELTQTFGLLQAQSELLRTQRDRVRSKVFQENKAAIPLGNNQLLNRQYACWELTESGLATLGRKAFSNGRTLVSAVPAVMLPQINPVPSSLMIGVAGIIEPQTSQVMVRDDLNPARQEYRAENWDLYAAIMATHFRAAYGGHMSGINNKSHLATALGFSDRESTQILDQLVNGEHGRQRSLHTGHAIPNDFIAAIGGTAIWTHMSIIELPVTMEGPAIITAIDPQSGQLSLQIDTSGDYTLFVQPGHIDDNHREAGRFQLKTPQTLQIDDMDPLTAMMYASIIQKHSSSSLDILRGTIHSLSE